MRRGELEGRLNAEFYRAEYRLLLKRIRSRYPSIGPLSKAAEIVCGPFGSAITLDDYVTQGVPLLRISNIARDGSLDLEDVVFLSDEKASVLAGTQVRKGDLAISQRGTIGMPAVISDAFPVFNISANLIAIRQLEGFKPEYVQLILASDMGARQISRLQSGQVHPKITTDDIAGLLIPPSDRQDELVAAMEAAKTKRSAKLAEADALLSSLDDYLLDRLGLARPPADMRRTYAVRLGTASASRFDPDYFHPERILTVRDMQTRAGLMRNAPLQTVVDFQRDPLTSPGDNYLSLAHVQSHTGELAESDETATGACFVFRSGDVLFGRLRPYLNKVHRAERDGCCSPEFHVMRVRPGADLQPDYLAAILRSSLTLAQTRHMMTGNTHPRLATDDVVNLVVPIPDMTVQMAIAAEVQRRRELARRLRAEAEAGWSEAKRWFEEQLLGPAP